MRGFRFSLLAFTLIPATGCGTFHNLNDRPVGPMFLGAGTCYPFGGTVRSGLLGVMGPPSGLVEVINGNIELARGEIEPGVKQIGHGMFMTAAGLVAIVDTPLSFAGDIMTLPVVYARSKEYPWATWWGEKSFEIRPMLDPVPEDANKCVDTGQRKSD